MKKWENLVENLIKICDNIVEIKGDCFMKCIFCGCEDSKVVDSRDLKDSAIRRRRECNQCGRRFTTYETMEIAPVMVVKKNGARQEFSRNKLKMGILSACAKRPVPMEKIDALVEQKYDTYGKYDIIYSYEVEGDMHEKDTYSR